MTDIRLLSTVYLFVSFVITVLAEWRLLPFLRIAAGQPIYQDGPSWHMKKQGTPTLGGIGFFVSFLLVFALTLLSFLRHGKKNDSLELILLFSYATLHLALGLFDDLKKLKSKQNAGLSPREKLFFQFLFSALYLFARAKLFSDEKNLAFGAITIPLGLFYYPVMLFLMVGIVNCANLTDGIDGLAGGVAFSIGIALLFISDGISMTVFFLSSALIGSTFGFLCFNLHPAKIFMGDTGSLFLGALLVGCAFTLKSAPLMLSLGIVYVLEGFSVVMQVAYFKCTKKRIFLMAPLHHHLEKKGWSENRICLSAVFLTLLFSIPAYFFLLRYGK